MKRLLYLLAILAVAACSFESDETYYKEITVPVIEGSLTIDVDAPNDTITIYNETSFSVDFTTNAGRIEDVEVRLDDRVLKHLKSSGDTFEIGNYQFRTGVFDLILSMKVDPQSGSLANRYGGERTTIERKYKLKIDASPPAKPVVKASAESGFLKISWTPYTKPNFVSYRVTFTTPNGTSRNITITNPNTTSFVDSSYTGGYLNAINYYVYTNAIGYSIQSVSVNHPMNLTHTYSPTDSTATLRWRKMPFTNAFGGYVIKENSTERFRILNAGDTSVTFKIDAVLNMSTILDLQTLAKYPNTQYPPRTHQLVLTNTVRGPRMPSNIGPLTYNETLQSFFARRPASGSLLYTVRFDKDFKPIDSIARTCVVPYRGTYIYYATLNTVNRRDWLTGTVESVTISPLPGTTPTIADASSTGMVVATWSLPRTQTQLAKYYSKVIHMPSATNVLEIFSTISSHTAPQLSVDSKYVYNYAQRILGEWTGSSYQTIKEFATSSVPLLTWRVDSEEELWRTSFIDDITVYNRDLTMNRTVAPIDPNYNYEAYDTVTKYALFSKSGSRTLYAVHVDTGVVKEITAYKGTSTSYSLHNGYLCTSTYYFKVL